MCQRFPIEDHILRDERLDRGALRVYGYMASWWATTGRATPSHQRIAADLKGMSVITVRRKIALLKLHGYLSVNTRSSNGSLRISNRYFPGPACSPFPHKHEQTFAHLRGEDERGKETDSKSKKCVVLRDYTPEPSAPSAGPEKKSRERKTQARYTPKQAIDAWRFALGDPKYPVTGPDKGQFQYIDVLDNEDDLVGYMTKAVAALRERNLSVTLSAAIRGVGWLRSYKAPQERAGQATRTRPATPYWNVPSHVTQ